MVTINDLLGLLYNHRLLSTKQLSLLSNDTTLNNTGKKLKKMMEFGLVKRIALNKPQILGIQQNGFYAYYLTERGLDHATEHLDIPFNVYDANGVLTVKNHYEINDLRVAKSHQPHHLKIQDLLSEFSRALVGLEEREKIKGISFSEPRRLEDFGAPDIRLYRPDWVIEFQKQNTLISVEMDMGTMTRKQIIAKFTRYVDWLNSQKTNKKQIMLFCIPAAKNRTRIRNIRSIATEALKDLDKKEDVEIIIGDMETCLQWLVNFTLNKDYPYLSDSFEKDLKKLYSNLTIQSVDFEKVQEDYLPLNIRFDRLHHISRPGSESDRTLLIHQFNTPIISCNVEASIHKLSELKSHMTFLIFESEEARCNQFLSFVPENGNIFSTDLQSMEKCGITHVFEWTYQGWKRRELILHESDF